MVIVHFANSERVLIIEETDWQWIAFSGYCIVLESHTGRKSVCS